MLEATTELGPEPNWSAVSGVPLPADGRMSLTLPISSQTRFFRCRAGVPTPVSDPENWAWIAPSTFMMGSPASKQDRESDEGPQTVVTLTKGFGWGNTR